MARTPHLRYVRHRNYNRLRYSRKLKAFLAEQATRLDLDPEVIFNVLMKEQGLTAEQVAALPEDTPVPGAPVNTALPELSDTAPQPGDTITGTDGTWQGDDIALAYQWLLDGTPIEDKTANELEIAPEWVGQEVALRVTATNDLGSVAATSAAAEVQGIAPVNTVAPTLSGTPTVGQTLTVTNGTWTGTPAPTFTRVWRRDGATIAGQTGTTYVLTEDDVGAEITVQVTGTNSAGSAQAVSNALGPVVAE